MEGESFVRVDWKPSRVYSRDICFLVSCFGGKKSSAIATGAAILKCCGAGTLPDELSGCAVSKLGREWIDGGRAMYYYGIDGISRFLYASLGDHWLTRGEVGNDVASENVRATRATMDFPMFGTTWETGMLEGQPGKHMVVMGSLIFRFKT